MSSSFKFPSPIGGVPFDLDFAPSIIFAIAYAAISLGAFYRLIRSASRTIVVLGTIALTVERVVIFALRAKQAHTPSEDFSKSLTIYWQMTWALGYLSIYGSLCTIMRTLFVVTTMSTSVASQSGLQPAEASPEENDVNLGREYGSPLDEDQPEKRRMYRTIFGFSALFSWIPIGMGICAGSQYYKAETNPDTANTVQSLRYASAAFAFILIGHLQCWALYGYFCVQRIRKSSAMIAFIIASLLNLVTIYRFIVMRLHTDSLTSMAPGSLNSTQSKATFYIFHLTPEFIAAALILNVNVRKRFSTGMWGDRAKDKKTASS